MDSTVEIQMMDSTIEIEAHSLHLSLKRNFFSQHMRVDSHSGVHAKLGSNRDHYTFKLTKIV